MGISQVNKHNKHIQYHLMFLISLFSTIHIGLSAGADGGRANSLSFTKRMLHDKHVTLEKSLSPLSPSENTNKQSWAIHSLIHPANTCDLISSDGLRGVKTEL